MVWLEIFFCIVLTLEKEKWWSNVKNEGKVENKMMKIEREKKEEYIVCINAYRDKDEHICL